MQPVIDGRGRISFHPPVPLTWRLQLRQCLWFPHRIRTASGVKISDIRVSDADQWGVQEETDSARSTATLTCVHNDPGAPDR